MIYGFTTPLTQKTPIHHKNSSLSQIVCGKDSTHSCSPHNNKKIHPKRDFRFPYSFPRMYIKTLLKNYNLKFKRSKKKKKLFHNMLRTLNIFKNSTIPLLKLSTIHTKEQPSILLNSCVDQIFLAKFKS